MILKKLFNKLFKHKKVDQKPDPKFEAQRAWFINSMPKSAVSRADERYCSEFISAISEHFNPIELENFPLRLDPKEGMAISNHLANLMQSYINYRKRNAILLREFFREVNGKLSMHTVQAVSAFLENDDEYGEKIFTTYSRLSHLLLRGAQLKSKMEEENGKKRK